MILLKPWRVVALSNSMRLNGMAFGHPKFPDGTEVLTSEIQSYDPRRGTCRTENHEYKLDGFDINAIDFEVPFK